MGLIVKIRTLIIIAVIQFKFNRSIFLYIIQKLHSTYWFNSYNFYFSNLVRCPSKIATM
jgi:hypothetical protein